MAEVTWLTRMDIRMTAYGWPKTQRFLTEEDARSLIDPRRNLKISRSRWDAAVAELEEQIDPQIQEAELLLARLIGLLNINVQFEEETDGRTTAAS